MDFRSYIEQIPNITIAKRVATAYVADYRRLGIDEIKRYNDEQLVIITTGSQGEAMSALSRMASKSHRKVRRYLSGRF